MARIRTIKPEFWSDEKLAELELGARLLFIGLWSFADDEGRMPYQPVRIRMQVFPCGSVSLETVAAWLGELERAGLVRQYAVDGRNYLDVPGFRRHQKINKPSPSRLPEYSGNPPGGVREHSPTEGKGKEKEGEKEREKDPERAREAPGSFPEGSGSAHGAGVSRETIEIGGELARDTYLRARQVYPRFAGSTADWLLAERAIRQRLEEGEEPAILLEGTRQYAAYCDATGSTGRQFVMRPSRFYGTDPRHYRAEWVLPDESAARPGGRRTADDVLAELERERA